MDVVIPVGPDCAAELRYCLRSIAAHLTHDRVWLIGDVPSWCRGVATIPLDAPGCKWSRAKANLRAACEHAEISDPFLLMNDDFFVMRPVTRVPVLHAGRLADWHSALCARVGRSQYVHALHQTRLELEGLGVEAPLSYELHVPLEIAKAGMIGALDLCTGRPRMHERSLYGNLSGIGGRKVRDVKAYTRTDREPTGPAAPYLSTTDRSFALFSVGKMIRDQFPDECAYERPSLARRGRRATT